MSNRIDLARQLLKDQEFEVAKQILEKETNNVESLYLLSLLYRYDDEYDKEKLVVDKALEIDAGDAYMRERSVWHDLPIFDRVVPRQPLHLPRDPKMIPSAEVLENMCFVVGADSKYFQLMVECIESIKATRLYKDVPICVLDCGLSEWEKEYLFKTLKVQEIKDPGWDVDPVKNIGLHATENIDGYKAMTARSFIPKHFPNYQYYMWIDVDCWVQDERAIDLLLNLAEKQGIGVCPDIWAKIQNLYNPNTIPEKYRNDEFLNYPTVINGVVCIKKNSGFFDFWQKYFLEIHNSNLFNHFADQLSLNLAMANEGKSCLKPPVQNTQFVFNPNTGCPFLGGDLSLYSNSSKQIIGFVHLTWYAKGNRYHRPLVKIEGDYDTTLQVENAVRHQCSIIENNVIFGSVSYRQFPWADKSKVNQLIMEDKKYA